MSSPAESAQRAARIAGADENRAFLGKVSGGVLADGAEALHHDARARELEANESPRGIDASRQSKPGGADLVERDAADRRRQADGSADLVLDPAHAQFIGSHIRPGHVVHLITDRIRESTDQLLLLYQGHARIAEDHRFAAAVSEARRCVLPCHCAGEAKALFGRNIGCHTHAADGGTTGGVIDDDDGAQVQRGAVDVTILAGPKGSAKPNRSVMAFSSSIRPFEVGDHRTKKACRFAAAKS